VASSVSARRSPAELIAREHRKPTRCRRQSGGQFAPHGELAATSGRACRPAADMRPITRPEPPPAWPIGPRTHAGKSRSATSSGWTTACRTQRCRPQSRTPDPSTQRRNAGQHRREPPGRVDVEQIHHAPVELAVRTPHVPAERRELKQLPTRGDKPRLPLREPVPRLGLHVVYVDLPGIGRREHVDEQGVSDPDVTASAAEMA
jgi:hypothetical protein